MRKMNKKKETITRNCDWCYKIGTRFGDAVFLQYYFSTIFFDVPHIATEQGNSNYLPLLLLFNKKKFSYNKYRNTYIE